MPANDPKVRHLSSTLAAVERWHGPDADVVAQARVALDLARTEQRVADAIAEAPPLDAATITKLHGLIPPIEGGDGNAAA